MVVVVLVGVVVPFVGGVGGKLLQAIQVVVMTEWD